MLYVSLSQSLFCFVFSRFIKAKDIDNWVTIDSKTGKVSTAKVLDRESDYVKNSTYTVILLAVDDGKLFNSANVFGDPVINEYLGSVHLPDRNFTINS